MTKNIALLLLAFTFMLTSCKKTDKNAVQDDSKTEVRTLTLQNQDREVTVPLSPERVVVFDLGALDVMDELDLGDRIVGVPKQTFPAYLQPYGDNEALINAGGLMEPNFEKIAAVRPDLIIIGLRQLRDYDRFAEIAPTIVYDIDYKNFVNSVRKNAELLGQIFEKEEATASRLEQMMQNLDKVRAKTEHATQKALVVMVNNGKFNVFGSSSRFGYVYDYFGVPSADDTIEISTHGASISSEYLKEKDPDILFVIDRNAAINHTPVNKKAVENELIKQTTAYKNNRIVYLSSGVWYISGGGIHSLESCAEEIGQAY